MFNYNGNSPLATARTMTNQLAIVKVSLTLFELCLELDLYLSENSSLKALVRDHYLYVTSTEKFYCEIKFDL